MDYKEQIDCLRSEISELENSELVSQLFEILVDDLLARAEAAEAWAEKAERERSRYKACVYHSRPCELCKKYSADWTPECCKCENRSKEYHPLFELKEE